MAKYRVNIILEMTEEYQYEEIIEADSEEEALMKGREIFNEDISPWNTGAIWDRETYASADEEEE